MDTTPDDPTEASHVLLVPAVHARPVVAAGADASNTVAVLARVAGDDHLVELWLHGRSAGTQRAYRADAGTFRAHVGCPLPAVTLGDVQAFQDSLTPFVPATQARLLSAAESLLTFGHRTVSTCPSTSAPPCACPR